MANRFWVGGTAAWDATAGTKWSTTSGGGGGAAVPTAADDVFINSGASTVTINGAQTCRSLNCTSFTGTLAWGATGNLAIGDASGGAMTLPSTMNTSNAGGNMSFVATTDNAGAGWPVTMGKARAIPGLKFQGAGGKWTLQDAVSIGTSTLTLTDGILDTNNKSITAASVVITGTNARTLTLGSSLLTLNSTGTGWNCGVATNLTFNCGTSTITLSGAGTTFASGAQTYNNVTLTGSGLVTATGAATYANLTRTGTATTTDSLLLASSTITGTLSLTAPAASSLLLYGSAVLTTRATIVVNGSITTSGHVCFRDINASGSASWDLSAGTTGDCLGNLGITFTTPTTRYAVATGNASSTATWSATTGGTPGASLPLPQDTVILNAASGAINVTNDLPDIGASLDCTGFTGTYTISTALAGGYTSGANVVYGNVKFVAGMTLAGTQSLSLGGRSSTYTIETGGTVFPASLIMIANSSTYTAQDNLSITSTWLDKAGMLNMQGFTLSAGIVDISQTTYGGRGLTSTGLVQINATTASTVLTVSTAGRTMTMTGSTIVINTASANTRTIVGGGATYGTLTYTVAGSTGTLAINGSSTYGAINFSDVTNARTLTFSSTTTNTVTNFNVNGTAGKLMTINASTPGSAATLSSPNLVNLDYVSVQDNTASGNTPFYAGANGVLVSGTTNWLATAAPSISSGSPNLMMMGIG